MGVFAPYTAKLSVTCSIYKAAKRALRRPFVISRVSLAENRLCTYVVAALQVSVLTRIAKRAHHFLERRVYTLSPVRVGSMVSVYTQVQDIGHSSIKIDVEVWVRPPHGRHIEERQKVTEARFVMVALDDNGRIRAVHG